MSASASAAAPKRLEQPPASTSFRPFQSHSQQTLLLCLLLTAAALIAYNATVHNGFLNYDDPGYIPENPHVRAGLTWATVRWVFTTYDGANWIPVSWLSHALDFELFGLNPAGHHYMSAFLHAVNAVLLFLLLQNATGFRWRSLMVAALFALHPMNVESVAWVAERKNVLSMLFLLLALHVYSWYTRKPALLRYGAVFFLFALGLMSKSQIVTFPFLLLLWDYWPLCRIFAPAPSEAGAQLGSPPRLWKGWLLWEKGPLILLSAVSAAITVKAERAGGAIKGASQYSLLLRLETAVISYVRYLGKAFWPSKLVALYPHPTELYPVWQVIAAAALLLLVTVSVLLARNHRYLVVGWFWFLGSLVPMIGLVQVGAHAMADRFAYLPFIGLFLMLTWLVAERAERHKVSAAFLATPAIIALFALGTLTYRQVDYWRDTEAFWRRTLALTDDNFLAHDIFGDYLTSQGRTEEAAAQFRAAIAIRPKDPEANMNLGPYEQARGHLPEAIEHYQTVALYSANPGLRATAYFNLGHAYRQMGDLTAAKQCFEMVLQLAPAQPEPMDGLGLIAQEKGDQAEAVRQYSRAVALHPTDPGYWLLARALQQQGRLEEARAISARVENPVEAEKTAESFLSRN